MFSNQGYLALRRRAAIVDRPERAALRLTGADRRSYLQGLLTNDIEALSPGTGCYAALLTPQGRMISDMRVFETGEAIVLDLPAETQPRVRDHLTQFIFSEDVAVEDIGEKLAVSGVYGPLAASALAAVLAAEAGAARSNQTAADLEGMPMLANTCGTLTGAAALLVRSDDVGLAGFDLFLPKMTQAAIAEALVAAGAIQVDTDTAEVTRVEAGRPMFGIDMDENTIPLEAEITDRAISLTKGCYVGQEVIIRVLHRGHGRVARRLVGIRLQPSASVPSRGTLLTSGDREVGRITSAVQSPTVGAPIALGYVLRDFTQPGTVVTVSAESGVQPGTVVPLPFV